MSDAARPAASPESLDALAAWIDTLLHAMAESNPAIASIERGEEPERCWYVRLLGEEKANFSIWFLLDQRNLHYETYFMPAPVENPAETFEYLLRKAAGVIGAGLVIGAEDALYWKGAVPHAFVSEDALDDIVGTLYAATEACFRPAMRLGYASTFGG